MSYDERTGRSSDQSHSWEHRALVHARLSYKRTVRVMCCLLAVGMILLSAGLACRGLLSRGVSAMLKSELISPNAQTAEQVDALARDAAVQMVSALVRKDYNRFFDSYGKIPDELYDLIGNPYMKENLIGPFFSSAREKNQDVAVSAGERLMAEAGSYRLPLQIAVWYREMILGGAALIVLSLLVIFMKGARFSDFSIRRLWPLPVILLLCIAAVVVSRLIPLRL